jgi:hypothetical protein
MRKGNAPEHERDEGTPEDVVVNMQARTPNFDPRLGVAVDVDRRGTPRNRLVTIGDSLTHGFQSGAILNTHLSWPMIVAWELGCDETFRYPVYNAHGGLPFNIEHTLNGLEERFGGRLNWWELPLAAVELRSRMAQVEDYWERGPGAHSPRLTLPYHNLAVYGWDVRDVLSRTWNNLSASLERPKDSIFKQVVQNHNERAALRVYGSLGDDETVVQAAQRLGGQGAVADANGEASDHGIETLVVAIGANNALGSVTSLDVAWSDEGFDDLTQKKAFNVWRPSHFESELKELTVQVSSVKARHVIWATVPHVTIAPIARGVGSKVRQGSRYFPYYTRPWISDRDFDSKEDRCISENQARAIDSAIDQYNEAITSAVHTARKEGLDWYVFDLCTLLDRLAARRYLLDVHARPDWWTPYQLPPTLAALNPRLDSRFFSSGPEGRTGGGLFSLDGVHPTTAGYGIMAQELINVMRTAGVPFYTGQYRVLGAKAPVRPDPIAVDFDRLLRQDSLLRSPPQSLNSDFELIGWFDEVADIFGRLNPFARATS